MSHPKRKSGDPSGRVTHPRGQDYLPVDMEQRGYGDVNYEAAAKLPALTRLPGNSEDVNNANIPGMPLNQVPDFNLGADAVYQAGQNLARQPVQPQVFARSPFINTFPGFNMWWLIGGGLLLYVILRR